jgi:predicted RNA-binding protein with PIN domain
MADGYGMISFFASISENSDQINIRHLRKHSLVEKVMMYLTMPYHFVMVSIKFLILQT